MPSPRTARQTVRYGRYELLFRIAAGGMAEVHAARIVGEGGFQKLVALKRMLPTLAEDERFVSMFLDEGRVAANISSPHVVQTLDLGRAEDDSLYLVMELVVGVSLAALLRAMSKQGQAMPLPIGVEILAQAAQGLHDAHEARTIAGDPLEIVHRDVSPANVLVDVGGRVRITDFGVARAMERTTHTQTGEVKGKLAYFSPEQARGKQCDRRTDVFAMGIVAWETLTGQRLFGGDSAAVTLTKVLSEPIPRADEVRRDIPRALADVIARALERDMDKRTQTAAELARQLRAVIAGAPANDVSTFVRANGGEALARVQAGLRSATAIAPAAPTETERSGIVVSLDPSEEAKTRMLTPSAGVVPSELLREPMLTPSTPMSAPGFHPRGEVQLITGSFAGSPVQPVAAPPRSRALPWVAGAVITLAAIGAAAAAWTMGSGPTMTATPIGDPAAATSTASAPVEAPAAIVAPVAPVAPVDEVAPAPPSGGARVAPTDRGGRRTGRGGTASGTAASARAAPEQPRAETPRAETPRVETTRAETPRVETTRAETPRAETPRAETPRAETTRAETPRAEATPTPTPTPERASGRPEALRGLDDFDRELQ